MGFRFTAAGCLSLLVVYTFEVSAQVAPRMRSFRSDSIVRIFAKKRPYGVRGHSWKLSEGRVRPGGIGTYKIRTAAPLQPNGERTGEVTTELLPLSGYDNIAINRRGEVYELNPGSMYQGKINVPTEQAIRQPLISAPDGTISGGAYGGLLPGTSSEVQSFNSPTRNATRPAF